MAPKRKHDEAGPPSPTSNPPIYRSSPIEDRASSFIGFFSPTLKPKELQALEEVESASHKVVAWRKKSNQQSITKATQYVTASDDDGEKYAGKKVEKALDALQVEGSCMVARWYGGVLLGPVRFTHIEQAAKEAVRQWQEEELESRQKKRKLEEEATEHARLSNVLGERDQSIIVLRELALKRERELKAAKENVSQGTQVDDRVAAPDVTPTSSSKSAVDYTTMSLDRLRPLEKARDATLSFLLKRIDKAEAELASQHPAAEEPP